MRVVWKKIPGGGALPEPRWGHTGSAVEGTVVLFGGTGNKLFNDCYAYDTIRNLWNKFDARGTPPAPRFGHSATSLPNNSILIFGGRGGNKHFADIHVLDYERGGWVRTQQPGKTSPDARAGHTACLSPDGARVIVFGGHSNHYKYFNNTYVLELATFTWTKAEVHGNKPDNRGGHCTFVLGSCMYVFGGYDGKKYYNDLYSLNLDTFEWTKVETSGVQPKARSGHTATLVANGTQLLVFGGCGSDSNFLNDVHVLHTLDMRWEQPLVFGAEPGARFRHTCTLIGTQLYMFAGTGSGNLLSDMYVLELEATSLPNSPSSSVPPQVLSMPSSPIPERTEVEGEDLKKLYVAAMVALKSEKQNRSDFELEAKRLGRELLELREVLNRERAMKLSLEEKLNEEKLNRQKMEESHHAEQEMRNTAESIKAKAEKTLKKKQKNLVELQEQNTRLQAQVEELQLKFSKEKELRQELTKEDITRQEGLSLLKKETEILRKQFAHMMGEELNTMTLSELNSLEETHNRAFQSILMARKKKHEEQVEDTMKLLKEKEILEDKKHHLEKRLKETEEALRKHTEELNNKNEENCSLRVKVSLMEGANLADLTMEQLQELETLHHKGLQRVSNARQEHLQRELQLLRREKEKLQDKGQCIICTERPSNCVLMPCRHASMCIVCCKMLVKCPICRTEIHNRIETF